MLEALGFTFSNNLLFRVSTLFIVGAVIGSFLNVVIYRLPIMLMRKWRQESADALGLEYIKTDNYPERFNLVVPSSMCLSCNKKIPGWVNIPILGFFVSRMKCLSCGNKISASYLIIEVLTAVLFAYTGYCLLDIGLISAYMIFISFVVCLIAIDLNTFLLPDELTLPLLWLGLLFNLHGLISGSLVSSVLGAVAGYTILWLVYWIFRLITKREGLGYGDFKFLAAILAWFGVSALIPVLFLAPLFGIVYFIFAYLRGKVTLSKAVPFGPFLGMAALIVLFCGKTFLLPLTI